MHRRARVVVDLEMLCTMMIESKGPFIKFFSIKKGLPADARVVDVLVASTGKKYVELVIESKEFGLVHPDEEVPKITPVFEIRALPTSELI